MSDIKNKAQGIDPNVSARNIHSLVAKTDNIYESLAIISRRARQLSNDLKTELGAKLNEFAVHTEVIEEVQENKEQIEISKYYERLPNPATIATEEFLRGEIKWKYTDDNTRKRMQQEGDL